MLARMLSFILIFASCAVAQQSSAPATPAPDKPKFELETFYMAIMRKVPAKAVDNAAIQRFARQHVAHWQQVADTGNLILAGPIEDKDISAVFVYRAKDKDEATVIASADALVQVGYWAPAIHTWLTQKGALPGTKKLNPSDTYYLGFLRRGPNSGQGTEEERNRIQQAHLGNMKRLADLGKLVAGGPSPKTPTCAESSFSRLRRSKKRMS